MNKKMKLEKENVVLDFNDVEELEEKSMYITETTGRVRIFFGVLLKLDDKSKMAVLLYLFSKLNCNQINDKDEPNPDLLDDSDDITIFNLELIGYDRKTIEAFLEYNVFQYNFIEKNKDECLYLDNGFVMGLKPTLFRRLVIAMFEKMSFSEKIDVFAELIIRYDNDTYFDELKLEVIFVGNKSGFDVAKAIKDWKKDNVN